MKTFLVARNVKKLRNLADETHSTLIQGDASDFNSVKQIFEHMDHTKVSPSVVVFNPSMRVRGPIEKLEPSEVEKSVKINVMGAFYVAQQAAARMLKMGHGSILFTGATASKRGFANSSVFAMGKFGLRGLAQSLARELHPKNIHIGHFIIDGKIQHKNTPSEKPVPSEIDPDSIAEAYIQFHKQPRDCWSWEIELRPAEENF